MAFALLNKIFGSRNERDDWRPLYSALVAEARQPHYYVEGGVEDTIDGRFEMIVLIASLVLLRMEAIGEVAASPMALLTEVMVEDLEGQVREIGFGDLVVGKQVGQMMGALGGRLGAYREGLSVGDLREALIRNLYRGAAPSGLALDHMEVQARSFAAGLAAISLDQLKAGNLQ